MVPVADSRLSGTGSGEILAAEGDVRQVEAEIREVDVLAIGAHPDDVEFGAGGFLALCYRRGDRVGVVDLTRGEMGSKGDADLRRQEALAAAQQYGAAFRLGLDWGDTRLADDPALARALARIIRVAKPSLVLAPPLDDRHPDHRAAGWLAERAVFYACLRHLDLGVPAHFPDKLLHYFINEWGQPAFVVDVTATWEAKRQALLAFASQTTTTLPIDHAYFGVFDYLRDLEARAAYFGSRIGRPYGEGFTLTGSVPLSDPVRAFHKNGGEVEVQA